jgi:hypothetical protein
VTWAIDAHKFQFIILKEMHSRTVLFTLKDTKSVYNAAINYRPISWPDSAVLGTETNDGAHKDSSNSWPAIEFNRHSNLLHSPPQGRYLSQMTSHKPGCSPNKQHRGSRRLLGIRDIRVLPLMRVDPTPVEAWERFIVFFIKYGNIKKGLWNLREFNTDRRNWNADIKIKSNISYRLCGLVVRVPGYRSRGPGSIPGSTKFSEK